TQHPVLAHGGESAAIRVPHHAPDAARVPGKSTHEPAISTFDKTSCAILRDKSQKTPIGTPAHVVHLARRLLFRGHAARRDHGCRAPRGHDPPLNRIPKLNRSVVSAEDNLA